MALATSEDEGEDLELSLGLSETVYKALIRVGGWFGMADMKKAPQGFGM